MMLSEKLLEPKQQSAVDWIYNHDRSVLIAPTGAGKTIICLTAIAELIKEQIVSKVIVACPAKVVPVWAKEVKKWSHTSELRVVMLVGNSSARSEALLETADIVVTSLNNLKWLLDQEHKCEGIIIDELSKASGKQARGLTSKKKAGGLKWRVGMTATPVAQDFQKLYGMMRIIDDGVALGTNRDKYLNRYFYPDYNGYNWTLRDDASQEIMERVAPYVHMVEDTKVNDLPECRYEEIRFEMPEATREVYKSMKRDMFAEDVEAVNEAVKSGKLRQIASNFIYGANDNADRLDFTRVKEAVKWCNSLKGRKGIIFYEYVAQLQMLQEFLPTRACTTIEDFIDSPILLAQINSLSHGVDGLQHLCSDILFYHPFWSLDATEQAIGRVWRTGQTDTVNVTTLICEDTLDDLVIARVEDRGKFMKLFRKHLKG
jgi:SNF2 family DNA or RNA helicase